LYPPIASIVVLLIDTNVMFECTMCII